jgi:uncharacterized membrane protein YjgN (DUF898 family)
VPFNDPPAKTAASGAAPQDGPDSSDTQAPGQFAVYDGQTGAIGKIALVNAILGLLTLGIYRFWGKTRIRQYVWSRLTILGDRLEYTGTAKELLFGFLFAAAILVVIFAAFFGLAFVTAGNTALSRALDFVSSLGIYFMIFFAVFRARRYRLLRTQWRGIRFSQSGSARSYAVQAMALFLLVGITGGLAYPYMETRLQHYRINNTWFGNRQLIFDGLAYDLFWKWVLALVLALPTLGISFLWYKVAEFRYFISRTRFGSLRFSSTLTTWKVFLILLVYALVLIVLWIAFVTGMGLLVVAIGGSDGFGTGSGEIPQFDDIGIILSLIACSLVFVSLVNVFQFILFLHPMIHAVSKTLMGTGTIDLDAIMQSDAERGTRGEGFADVLDIGAI